MSIVLKQNTWIDKMARIGMISKGIVYVILGILAFMAAFEIGGASNKDANSSGVFSNSAVKSLIANLRVNWRIDQ